MNDAAAQELHFRSLKSYPRFLVRPKLSARISPALVCILAILGCCAAATAQSKPTATRAGDLQLGAGYTFARSGYNFTPLHLNGETFYATFDIRNHWGGEVDFHNVTAANSVYERTYEIGPRIFLTRAGVTPYAKAMFGRGVYNYPNGVANIAYNLYTFGGGIDLPMTRSLNLRGDYEYQNWAGFPLGTLHPSVVTIGVAYHIHE